MGYKKIMNDITRKLAKIVVLDDVIAHPNADNLDIAKWGGWQCVVKKNEFIKNDKVIACEIDSWIPNEVAPFLSKGKEPKEFNGVKGERLKTIKLRGALSQGLLLPINILTTIPSKEDEYTYEWYINLQEGDDVTGALGIQKWEVPENAQLAGQAKGTFPHFLRKTDEERIQNIKSDIRKAFERGDEFEVSMKVDGSSTTIYHFEGNVGVCSRNQELKINEENEGNAFIKVAIKTNALEALKLYGGNIAIQGELLGPGVQNNREKLSDYYLYVFNIFDIDNQKYLSPKERISVFQDLIALGFNGKHVPIVHDNFKLHTDNIDELLKLADIKSINHDIAEGIVFKRYDGNFSFKAINNRFLLKEK